MTHPYDMQDGIAVVTLRHPPVNSLNHALRRDLVSALDAAEADAAVRAVVLIGDERAFSAGADVAELGTEAQRAEPVLPTLIARLDGCRKPVVAAISGVALGGGLEVAMACHGRVALDSSRVALPEIHLGLIPGSGGTQRLPRLAGVATAIAMILDGRQRTAAELAESGLFDLVVSDRLRDAAVARATQLARSGLPFPSAGRIDVDATRLQAAVAAQREKLTPRQRLQPAYAAALEAIAAAAEPLATGLARERALFLDLLASRPATALRHVFQAERRAAKPPADFEGPGRPVSTVAVIGAGTMGSGIAIAALDAGLRVLLLEQDEDALARGRDRIAGHYQSRIQAGKLKAGVAAAREAALTTTTRWPELQAADLVIEAVFEDLAVKQQVFAQIGRHARRDVVLATNTSYLDLEAIAASSGRPSDVIGLHFFSPAQQMRLVEVVRGRASSPQAIATGMRVAAAMGKLPVLCGNAFGFIGNRIYDAYRRQCEFMLEDGAWPEQVDEAMCAIGLAMGPFAVADLSGLDVAWRMRRAQAATRDPRTRYVDILDRLCERGRLGRKAGAGYYAHVDGRQVRETDAEVRSLIEAASVRRGLQRRPLAPAQIQRRALLAMVNEAALLLAEGVAQAASDIDVVMIHGYGFPRWEGGPVCWARGQDRTTLEAALDQLVGTSGHGWRRGDLGVLLDGATPRS